VLGGGAAVLGVVVVGSFIAALFNGELVERVNDWQSVLMGLLFMASLGGLGGLAFVSGIRTLWHCLVTAILRQNNRRIAR
jgi:hypothetical protein